MAAGELTVTLQQVDGDGQQPAQHVGQPGTQLVDEGLKDLPRLCDCNDTRSAHVVDTVMEVVHTTCVGDLLACDVRALHLPDGQPELSHSAVELSATKEAHVRVGQVLRDSNSLLSRANEGTSPHVLVHQGLSKLLRRCRDGAAQDELQLGQKGLHKAAALLLEAVRGQAGHLLTGGLIAGLRIAVLLVQHRHDGGHVLQVAPLQ
mmetsp:Transcript_37056/g.82399  ORF Transcript_37056/g.82399 Transcript_37056/m.82399 type:complete len:205 (+) Transcript_37056:1606-2220(+)